MEPPQAPLNKKRLKVNYIVQAHVVRVFERMEKTYISGFGSDATFREDSLGWYILLAGSREALFLGYERPNFAVGDTMKITLEKVNG